MVYKHGLKMYYLKQTSAATSRKNCVTRIFYELDTGVIWYRHFHTWTDQFKPTKNSIYICASVKHMSMQEIADAISHTVKERTDDAIY